MLSLLVTALLAVAQATPETPAAPSAPGAAATPDASAAKPASPAAPAAPSATTPPAASATAPAASAASAGKQKPTVVLVHGAFADASGWGKVIQSLASRGVHAVAVQLPETSLAEDVAATRRLMTAVGGPVVLVGHSYGGVVITAAADGQSNVKSLVYVAALVPDGGEAVGDLLGKYPAPAGAAHIRPQTGDYLWIDPKAFRESFCQDVPAPTAAIMAATQKPINQGAFGEKLPGTAAWHNLPSWYVLTTQDRMVSPELQKFMAERMKATIVKVPSSHVPQVSKPDAVVKAVLAAVK